MGFKRIVFVFLVIQICLCVVDRTYYTYLGLQITASPEQINLAYEAKKNKLSAITEEESRISKQKLLQEAYQILGNKEKKTNYDRLNKDLIKKDSVVSNLKKITDKFNRKQRPMQFTLPVSTEDIYHGKTIQANFLKKSACEKCKGTGAQSPKTLTPCSRCSSNGFSITQGVNQFGQRFVNENTCPVCQGWGKQITKICPSCLGKKVVQKLQKINIKIPKGLPDGNILKIANFGNEPIVGAPSDLQITVVQIPSQKWLRQGQNLIHIVQISLMQAIFGFSKTITHLNGQQIKIDRDELTNQSTVMVIPNYGIQNTKTGKVGKLLVKFKIVMPKFSQKQLDMWQQFFKKHSF